MIKPARLERRLGASPGADGPKKRAFRGLTLLVHYTQQVAFPERSRTTKRIMNTALISAAIVAYLGVIGCSSAWAEDITDQLRRIVQCCTEACW